MADDKPQTTVWKLPPVKCSPDEYRLSDGAITDTEMVAEIIGSDGKVHYRRPPSHTDVVEAERAPGYSVRLVEVRHGKR